MKQLNKLINQLSVAAGDAWLENNDYYFANKDTPAFDRKLYRELQTREKILFDAWERVQSAKSTLQEILEATT